MDPNTYWKALRKSWIVIVALTVIGAIVGFGYASSLGDTYSSKASLFVSSNDNSSGNDLVQGSTYTQDVVQSYADLATTSSVLTPVIAELGLDTTPSLLSRQIDAQTPLNTVFVNITATDASPQRAADIANSVARSLRTVATDLAPASATGRSPIAISIVAAGLVPQNPAGPNRHLIELTAAVIGLAVGILYAIGRGLFDTRLRTAADVEAVTEVPVAGSVRRGALGRLALRDDPATPMAEDYRRIAATLRFATNGRALRSVTLTSATRDWTDAEAALDLALAVAERSLRVLVVDADLRAPSLATLAGVTAEQGLTEVLDGSASLDAATVAWTDSVSLLAAGTALSNPHYALGSPDLVEVVATASKQYDFVIVHAAGIVDFADALTLAHLTDGTLITARSGATNRRQLETALESLLGANATVVGIVLTAARLDRRGAAVPTGPAAPAPAKPAAPAAAGKPTDSEPAASEPTASEPADSKLSASAPSSEGEPVSVAAAADQAAKPTSTTAAKRPTSRPVSKG